MITLIACITRNPCDISALAGNLTPHWGTLPYLVAAVTNPMLSPSAHSECSRLPFSLLLITSLLPFSSLLPVSSLLPTASLLQLMSGL